MKSSDCPVYKYTYSRVNKSCIFWLKFSLQISRGCQRIMNFQFIIKKDLRVQSCSIHEYDKRPFSLTTSMIYYRNLKKDNSELSLHEPAHQWTMLSLISRLNFPDKAPVMTNSAILVSVHLVQPTLVKEIQIMPKPSRIRFADFLIAVPVSLLFHIPFKKYV